MEPTVGTEGFDPEKSPRQWIKEYLTKGIGIDHAAFVQIVGKVLFEGIPDEFDEAIELWRAGQLLGGQVVPIGLSNLARGTTLKLVLQVGARSPRPCSRPAPLYRQAPTITTIFQPLPSLAYHPFPNSYDRRPKLSAWRHQPIQITSTPTDRLNNGRKHT